VESADGVGVAQPARAIARVAAKERNNGCITALLDCGSSPQ
jgi:hypothetical protein